MTPFTKMHGLGNDFIVINAYDKPIKITFDSRKKLCDRHFGIGCNQLLIIEPSEKADYFVRIYNADASEAEQCGNGLRSIARYAHEHLNADKSLTLETKAGVFAITISDYDTITVALPVKLTDIEKVSLDDHDIAAINLGNPHAILKVTDIDQVKTTMLGYHLSNHHYFERGANIGFMEIISKDKFKLRTYERGAGLTHACGSNACAAFLIGVQDGTLNHKATAAFEFGDLTLEWQPDAGHILMTGPAEKVFEGKIAV